VKYIGIPLCIIAILAPIVSCTPIAYYRLGIGTWIGVVIISLMVFAGGLRITKGSKPKGRKVR